MKDTTMTDVQETNWKEIALALAQRVNFAVQYLKPASGTGLMANMADPVGQVTFTHWHDYFAEALEMVPGVKVDREILATMRLPKAQGKKARSELLERRKSAKAA